MVAADAMLAKRYGITADEIAEYRKENGLEWRNDGTGTGYLVPGAISKEYSEGRIEENKPSAPDALTAYMWAHNYGKEDAAVYMKDPEWKKLHRAAFPDYRPDFRAMVEDNIISGKFSDLIEYTDYNTAKSRLEDVLAYIRNTTSDTNFSDSLDLSINKIENEISKVNKVEPNLD